MTTAEATQLETKQSPWWLTLLGGCLNIIVGILLLTVPVKTGYLLVLTLGFYWIFQGIFMLINMFVDHSAWGWKLFMGILSILAGTVILRYPLMSLVAIPKLLVLLLGLQGLIVGIVMLIQAFKGGGWGAGILGALSIVFGVILVANWSQPGWGATLVWVAAIFAVVGGIFQIIHAFMRRKS